MQQSKMLDSKLTTSGLGGNGDEDKVFHFILSAGTVGISHLALKNQLSLQYDPNVLNSILRNLVSSQRIAFQRDHTGEYQIIAKSAMPEKLAVVLEALRGCGASGADVTMIATKTKMIKTEVAKALSQLTAQGAIRDTRSVTNRAKKVYVLAEFEQSVEVTGGTFYNEKRELDTEFINKVRNDIVALIRDRLKVATLADLKVHLDGEGYHKSLSMNDVKRATNSLVLDQVLSRFGAPEDYRYRICPSAGGRVKCESSARMMQIEDILYQTPCFSCPQLFQCNSADKGTVNSFSCTYLKEWLTPAPGQVENQLQATPWLKPKAHAPPADALDLLDLE
jgi:hypothetical protein